MPTANARVRNRPSRSNGEPPRASTRRSTAAKAISASAPAAGLIRDHTGQPAFAARDDGDDEQGEREGQHGHAEIQPVIVGMP